MLDKVYLNRLNRYGTDFQSRVQGQREADFARYKFMSTYRVVFDDDKEINVSGTLEPNTQDESQITQWLLVDINKQYENGTILHIAEDTWMIWFQYETKSKGYNKYCVLRMTHEISWKDRNGDSHRSWAYFFGKMDRIIYDIMRSTQKNPNYHEPDKETHLIMPKTTYLKRQDYIEIDEEGFLVEGYDWSSVPGVIYISLTQTYMHDTTPAPEQKEEDNSDEFFWLTGGK